MPGRQRRDRPQRPTRWTNQGYSADVPTSELKPSSAFAKENPTPKPFKLQLSELSIAELAALALVYRGQSKKKHVLVLNELHDRVDWSDLNDA